MASDPGAGCSRHCCGLNKYVLNHVVFHSRTSECGVPTFAGVFFHRGWVRKRENYFLRSLPSVKKPQQYQGGEGLFLFEGRCYPEEQLVVVVHTPWFATAMDKVL